jgi:hypothetical protein
MAYRIDLSGNVVCDTPEEALAYQRLLAAEQPNEPHVARSKDEAGELFYATIKDHRRGLQRKVLALIFGRGDLGITPTELVEMTKSRDTVVMVRAIQNILINAQKVGLDPADVVTRQPNGRYVAGAWLRANEPPAP